MSDALTAADLERLLETAASATEGPWTADVMGSEGYTIHGGSQRVGAHTRRLRIARCGHEAWETDRANAEFIAATRNHMPTLITELIERRAQVERVAALADLYDSWDGTRPHPGESSPRQRSALRAALDGGADG